MSIGDDAVVNGEVKKTKKKKDKSAKVEPMSAEQEQQAIEVGAPEKKKKRKREENGEGEERKKKKKKKRKDTADGPSMEEPTPTAVEEKTAKHQATSENDRKAEQRKMKELRKQSKKQQKALAKAQAASSSRDSAVASKPAPTIKNITSEEVEKYLSENSITIHGDVVPVLDFDQLDIQPLLREVLSKFSKPTPIQACAWPALLEGKDVIGIAETGRFVPRF